MQLNPKLVLDLMHPVGSYYETSNASFNPNTAWGGTWLREDDGTALVSYKSTGKFNKDIGTIVGEETHQLTIDEMPAHTHETDSRINWYNEDSGTGALQYAWATNSSLNIDKTIVYARNTGGGQAHNNVQPSKVVYRWHRTA